MKTSLKLLGMAAFAAATMAASQVRADNPTLSAQWTNPTSYSSYSNEFYSPSANEYEYGGPFTWARYSTAINSLNDWSPTLGAPDYGAAFTTFCVSTTQNLFQDSPNNFQVENLATALVSLGYVGGNTQTEIDANASAMANKLGGLYGSDLFNYTTLGDYGAVAGLTDSTRYYNSLFQDAIWNIIGTPLNYNGPDPVSLQTPPSSSFTGTFSTDLASVLASLSPDSSVSSDLAALVCTDGSTQSQALYIANGFVTDTPGAPAPSVAAAGSVLLLLCGFGAFRGATKRVA